MRSKSYNPITLIYHEKENTRLFRIQRYTQTIYIFLMYSLLTGGFNIYQIYLTVKGRYSFEDDVQNDLTLTMKRKRLIMKCVSYI